MNVTKEHEGINPDCDRQSFEHRAAVHKQLIL
jgi:hypothetical protein